MGFNLVFKGLIDINDSVQTTDEVKYYDTMQGKKCYNLSMWIQIWVHMGNSCNRKFFLTETFYTGSEGD